MQAPTPAAPMPVAAASGQVRQREEEVERPMAAKRAKVDKLPSGQMYSVSASLYISLGYTLSTTSSLPSHRAIASTLASTIHSTDNQEIDWQSLHPSPISITIQLPSYPEKPEWKLDGSVITVPNIHVGTNFGSLREHIKRTVGSGDLPISRLRLDYMGKVMNNGHSLASMNLDEGDVVYLNIKATKK